MQERHEDVIMHRDEHNQQSGDLNQRTEEILQNQRPLYKAQRQKMQELERIGRQWPILLRQTIIVAIVLLIALLVLVTMLHVI